MSNPQNRRPNRARGRILETFAWVVGLSASACLGYGVYTTAGAPFTTTLGDPLALPEELAVTSRNANVPLPPELSNPPLPGANADLTPEQAEAAAVSAVAPIAGLSVTPAPVVPAPTATPLAPGSAPSQASAPPPRPAPAAAPAARPSAPATRPTSTAPSTTSRPTATSPPATTTPPTTAARVNEARSNNRGDGNGDGNDGALRRLENFLSGDNR